MTIPAGWYDDGSGRQRWWDGVRWTEHVSAPSTAPAAESPAEPAEPAFAPPFVLPAQTATWTPVEQTAVAAGAGGAYGYASASPTASSPARVSVLGLIGMILVLLGIVVSFVPPVRYAGWAALGAGFVVSLVSLFVRGARWPGITGLAAALPGAGLALAAALITMPVHHVPVAEDSPSDSRPSAAPESAVPVEDIPGAETVYVGDLQVGDCLPMMEWEQEVTDVVVVPCDQPHTDEVYLIGELADGDYPADDELLRQADEVCLPAFEDFVGIAYDASELDFYYYTPTKLSWNRFDDRTVQCIAFSYEDVRGSLEGVAY